MLARPAWRMVSTAGLVLLGLTGCSGKPIEPEQQREPFFVVEVQPPDGTVDVAVDAVLQIRFCRAVKPDTVHAATVRLVREETGAAVAGHLGFSGQDTLVTFTPEAGPLTPGAAYRLIIGSAIQAADGEALDQARSRVPLPSRFATRAEPDNEPPVFSDTWRSAEPLGPGEVRLRWAPARDPQDRTPPGELTYAVYLGRPPAPVDLQVPWSLVANGATETVVRGLEPLTEYAFVVRARDRAGNEDHNEHEVRATTLGEPVPVALTLLFTGGVGGKVEPCG